MADEEQPLELTNEEEVEPHQQPGHHVYVGNKHNSGPYETAEDAQAFIDSHLGGQGKVKHVEG